MRKNGLLLGQRCRKQMRRLEHKIWKAKDRRENPLALLEASTKGRVPELVALKNELMAASPFAYFRGAVPVMAYDLSLIPNTGIHNQLCGDAHVRNLGTYAAQDGRLVFDINDFDETIVGPFEWDVKRMATSLVLAGRGAGVKNLHCREAASVFLEHYRTTMAMFARMPVLEVARYQVRRLQHVPSMAEIFRMAERATPMHTLLTLTEVEGGGAGGEEEREEGVEGKASAPVARSRAGVQDSAAAIDAGDGRGCRAGVGLADEVQGESAAGAAALSRAVPACGCGVQGGGDGVGRPARLLRFDAGQWGEGPAVSADQGRGCFRICAVCWGDGSRVGVHQGRRVVEGERSMQLQSDPFLGWTTMDGRDYLVRQLNDHKAAIQLESLKTAALLEYAAVCGEMLARGHARAGDSR